MSKSYSPTWRLISVIVLRPLLTLLIRNKWAGRENIPRKGPVIIAPNHLSYVDWGTDALFLHVSGRYPTFLIKDSAFKIKFIGPFLHKAGQLPVHRGRADAALVLKDAEKKLAEGHSDVVGAYRLQVSIGKMAGTPNIRTSDRDPDQRSRWN